MVTTAFKSASRRVSGRRPEPGRGRECRFLDGCLLRHTEIEDPRHFLAAESRTVYFPASHPSTSLTNNSRFNDGNGLGNRLIEPLDPTICLA
jgi:hypothetical protein